MQHTNMERPTISLTPSLQPRSSQALEHQNRLLVCQITCYAYRYNVVSMPKEREDPKLQWILAYLLVFETCDIASNALGRPKRSPNTPKACFKYEDDIAGPKRRFQWSLHFPTAVGL